MFWWYHGGTKCLVFQRLSSSHLQVLGCSEERNQRYGPSIQELFPGKFPEETGLHPGQDQKWLLAKSIQGRDLQMWNMLVLPSVWSGCEKEKPTRKR